MGCDCGGRYWDARPAGMGVNDGMFPKICFHCPRYTKKDEGPWTILVCKYHGECSSGRGER